MKKMTKKQIIIILILAVIALFLAVFCVWRINSNNKSIKSQINQVCYDSRCFNVELATTPLEQERGLMERENLPADSGMLFIYQSEGDYPFWMKNTKIPLDILFIDYNGTIIDIKENFQPCTTNPCETYFSKPAQYVLEVNAGFVTKNTIKIRDTVESLP